MKLGYVLIGETLKAPVIDILAKEGHLVVRYEIPEWQFNRYQDMDQVVWMADDGTGVCRLARVPKPKKLTSAEALIVDQMIRISEEDFEGEGW